jgi:hypothetical protein
MMKEWALLCRVPGGTVTISASRLAEQVSRDRIMVRVPICRSEDRKDQGLAVEAIFAAVCNTSSPLPGWSSLRRRWPGVSGE